MKHVLYNPLRWVTLVVWLWASMLSAALANSQPLVTHIEKPTSVLFIGNSFTYFNGGIEHHMVELARMTAPKLNPVVHRQTFPGETLQGHVEKQGSQDVIKAFPWSTVVIQGYSNRPLADNARFERYARDLVSTIEAQQAQPVFFMTWAYNGKPEMTAPLHDAYLDIANETKAFVVPVGPAFEKALQAQPELNLYADDKHANLAGTYLAACVFYAAFFENSPVGNPYHAGLGAEKALFLQQVAQKTVQEFYGPSR
ncbi:hypothetical protein CA267_004990 [Alteromonas pelagimontana]|uniref:SGNH/GDSL hydrolase family protein n=1 Tax=Alteromonas pelagimontana TaxID=1858656 RepID=A0A6M4MAW8_9ALTE|nr:DUF4886 domain-containing protein [Alteromonas pelagimontana]QJR80177.1 hypothetical protein CA267_004990 [Alteromonas pelagimontana]